LVPEHAARPGVAAIGSSATVNHVAFKKTGDRSMLGRFSKLFAVSVLFASLIVASRCAQAQDNSRLAAQAHALHHGNFTAPDGTVHTFAEFKSKVVVISLWASWCPNCIQEIASFREMQQLLGKENVEIVLVGYSDDWEAEKQFARAHHVEFPIYAFGPSTQAELDAAFDRASGTTTLPQTLVWDADRWVKIAQSGAVDWTGKEMLPLMKKALACPGDNDKYPVASGCRLD
jgi:thiol-disulfide isomerase/thioredoxin